jgi:hypothetical protein
MKDVIVKDRGWQKILNLATKLDRAYVKVGVLKGDQVSSGFTLVELAATHEFGSPAAGIPERSFIRRTFQEKQSETAAVISKLARQVITDGMPVERALNRLGAWGAAQVKNMITRGSIRPPLMPSTIARKGSNRPLIDTGRLVGALIWEVVVT